MLLGSRQIATANGRLRASMRVRLERVAKIRQHLRNAIKVWHSDCVGRTGSFGPGGRGRRMGVLRPEHRLFAPVKSATRMIKTRELFRGA